ncbi:hypothetical protein [Crocinitomix catalasitica]|uniref:hypothetical protein n=1 Tax=Crocinitomix catalasitica TaxID=184607 RepID=UPI0004876681|nr:hypothetical protein [Crocinitomix catalasitica]
MKFNQIKYKKPFYKIKKPLRDHLRQYSRLDVFPIAYEDLLHHSDILPITDDNGNSTLWNAVLFQPSDMEQIYHSLILLYEKLYADGAPTAYIKVGSVDFCTYGNSQPFRIKIVNEINDNHDYYYIKKADASRIYGLEIEHIFSPNKMNYLVHENTLIEEHVIGVPCDDFIKKHAKRKVENRLRLAKEFVKFNERCFTQLLGDMRAYNFVVEINQDFDNIQYRLRAMDFDQQTYEGRINMYLPQFYKDNISLVKLAQELLSNETADQYKQQERAALKKRYLSEKQRTKSILRRMKNDTLSTKENVTLLRKELSVYHKNEEFLSCRTMGEILILHLEIRLGIRIF